MMAFMRIASFLLFSAFFVDTTSPVCGYDYIANLTGTNVQRTSFTLEWEWVIDEDDDFDPYGCRIVTTVIDNSLDAISDVEIEEVIYNYTLSENLIHWQRYKSCITPILTNGTVTTEGMETCTTENIQTAYDPWTWKAQYAVVISGALIFAVIVAFAINIIWPRSQGRTFSISPLDDDDDDNKAKENWESGDDGINNLGFEQDEDATSVVNDWSAAAAAAVGRTRGNKQWIKTGKRQHQTTRMFYDDNKTGGHGEDVNHNSQGFDHTDGDDGTRGHLSGDEVGEVADDAFLHSYMGASALQPQPTDGIYDDTGHGKSHIHGRDPSNNMESIYSNSSQLAYDPTHLGGHSYDPNSNNRDSVYSTTLPRGPTYGPTDQNINHADLFAPRYQNDITQDPAGYQDVDINIPSYQNHGYMGDDAYESNIHGRFSGHYSEDDYQNTHQRQEHVATIEHYHNN